MNVQIIQRDGRPEWAVLPYADYEKLMARLEEQDDIAAADAAKAALARGEEELLPAELVERLCSGENRLKVWREYRGLSQARLAEQAGVTQSMVTMMETGRRAGSVAVLKRLALALSIDMDDLAG